MSLLKGVVWILTILFILSPLIVRALWLCAAVYSLYSYRKRRRKWKLAVLTLLLIVLGYFSILVLPELEGRIVDVRDMTGVSGVSVQRKVDFYQPILVPDGNFPKPQTYNADTTTAEGRFHFPLTVRFREPFLSMFGNSYIDIPSRFSGIFDIKGETGRLVNFSPYSAATQFASPERHRFRKTSMTLYRIPRDSWPKSKSDCKVILDLEVRDACFLTLPEQAED